MVIDKVGLMAVIQSYTGFLATSVIWEYDPRPVVSDVDRALVTLKLKAGPFIGGSDDKRRTYTAGVQLDQSDATYVYEITGQRTVTLELRAESYDRSVESYEVLERVRTLLNGQFELTALGLARQSCKLITDLPTAYDNRVVNVALLEVKLGAVSTQVAQSLTGSGWIDTVVDPDGPIGLDGAKIPGTLS